MLFTISFFFVFFFFHFVCLLGGNLHVLNLERKSVFVIYLVTVYSLYKLWPVHTFIFIGCDKFSMSHITLTIAAEKDQGPKAVWKVEGQGIYTHWHAMHKDSHWEINYVFYYLLLLKQTISGQEELFFLHHHFCYCMKKLFWEKQSIISSGN